MPYARRCAGTRDMMFHIKHLLFRMLVVLRIARPSPYASLVVRLQPHDVEARIDGAGYLALRNRYAWKEVTILEEAFASSVRELNLENNIKYISCYRHFVDRVPWRETPYFRKYTDDIGTGRKRNIRSVSQLEKRYAALDAVYEEVRRTRRFSVKPEHLLMLHIDETGRLSFGPGGNHRMYIARILGIDWIPMKIGFVHRSAKPVLDRIVEQSQEQCGL